MPPTKVTRDTFPELFSRISRRRVSDVYRTLTHRVEGVDPKIEDIPVGLRVYHRDFGLGTVTTGKNNDGIVQTCIVFDKYDDSLHSAEGICKEGHGYFLQPHDLETSDEPLCIYEPPIPTLKLSNRRALETAINLFQKRKR